MSGTPSPTENLETRDKEIQTLKDLVIKKELELDSLRKELQSTRKQLDSQKRKATPPSKPQQAAP
jgi:predicted  nucleic acid-binding Zn-ribbon protein